MVIKHFAVRLKRNGVIETHFVNCTSEDAAEKIAETIWEGSTIISVEEDYD